MADCPCCNLDKVSFLYDICPTCGWEYHGETGETYSSIRVKTATPTEKFAWTSLYEYRINFLASNGLERRTA